MSGGWGQNACIHSSTIAAWSSSNEMRIGSLRSPSLAAGKLIGGQGMLGGRRRRKTSLFFPVGLHISRHPNKFLVAGEMIG